MKIRLKEGYGVEASFTPLSRSTYASEAPVPFTYSYISKEWSLDSSGWGDTECKEYLRFNKTEIATLVVHFCSC